MMKVSELIEALKLVPGDHDVIFRCNFDFLSGNKGSFSVSAKDPDTRIEYGIYGVRTGSGGYHQTVIGQKSKWIQNK